MKFLYKLFSVVSGVLGGLIAGALFKKVWKTITRDEDTPDATDEERAWKEILPAVALKGAMAGVIKALIHRGSATGVRGVTGTWPA